MKIIIVNGYPRAGKDLFVKYCLDYIKQRGICVSTVDFVKKIAHNCGWEGEKTPENRKFLSDLKDLLTEWRDIPYKKVMKDIEVFEDIIDQYNLSTEELYSFVMCREPNEIQKFVDRNKAITIFVTREDCEKDLSNHADKEVANYNYDYIIDNNGSIEDLRNTAVTFMKFLEGETNEN